MILLSQFSLLYKDIWYNFFVAYAKKRGIKMPRCRKRIVCKEPDVKVFIPQQNDNSEMLIMTVDEYESIRLIDLEGFSQEECAL